MPKLTKRTVDAAKPRDREYILWDDDISGFGLRVTAKGSKSFVFRYRAGHGRQAPVRKPTIGRYGDLTVDQARKIAKDWSATVTQGGDPSQARRDVAAAPTLQALFDDYLERHAKPHKREKSWKQDVSNFENHVPECLRRKKVAEITTLDIVGVHQAMRNTSTQANRVLAMLHTVFSMGITWGWCTTNPCRGVRRYHEENRERCLTPEELKSFLSALDSYANTTVRKEIARKVTNALRLLLLTGARRNEVMSASWDQFDLKAGVWTKPSAHTKQKKLHRVPLSEPALELLTIMRQECDGEGYLFPAHQGTRGYLSDPRKSWQAILELAKLEDFRIHDLRHSFASFLAGSGQSLVVIGQLLGHTQAQTTHRYAHLLDDPLRAATDYVGSLVENVRADNKVVRLEGRK